jgi:sulfatase modifying factor 1
MSGNVWEWTWDRYAPSYYSSSPSADPEGPSSGASRVFRGGSWSTWLTDLRVAYRNDYVPGNLIAGRLGFRHSFVSISP